MAEEKTTSKSNPPTPPPLKTNIPNEAPKALRPAEVARPAREPHALDGPGAIGSPEGKKLVVGREIELSGNISACDRLVVEGRVEAKLRDCRKIEIASSGFFKGNAEIDTAEISGNFEGTLTAHDTLILRSTGRVTGTIRFGKLEIERGGEIVGDIGLCSANTKK